MEPMEPLNSKWWINRMLADGYWLTLNDGSRVQDCMRAMAEAKPISVRGGVDRRESSLSKKVRAKVRQIVEYQRQIALIQAEIDDAQKLLEEVLGQEHDDTQAEDALTVIGHGQAEG